MNIAQLKQIRDMEFLDSIENSQSAYEPEFEDLGPNIKIGTVENSFITHKEVLIPDITNEGDISRLVGMDDNIAHEFGIDYKKKEIKMVSYIAEVRESIHGFKFIPSVDAKILDENKILKDSLSFNNILEQSSVQTSEVFDANTFEQKLVDLLNAQATQLKINQQLPIFIIPKKIKMNMLPLKDVNGNRLWDSLESTLFKLGSGIFIHSKDEQTVFLLEGSKCRIFKGNIAQKFGVYEVDNLQLSHLKHQYGFSTNFYLSEEDGAIYSKAFTGVLNTNSSKVEVKIKKEEK